MSDLPDRLLKRQSAQQQRLTGFAHFIAEVNEKPRL
jgi:hypothetical protein